VKIKPHVVDQATQLYADGLSLEAIGRRRGIDASTVYKALQKLARSSSDTHHRRHR